ncbi:MAG: hypothetical protein JWO03_3885 [Bacteroidetes bacterium]|nr:hypothetical protein [Bacteroidota bacterium]
MKYIFLFAVAISMSLTATAQDAMSVWTDQPIAIDGKANEWPAFFRFYAPGTKFQFDVLNDKTNLYVCVRATEVDAQARLMHSGLTLWFDVSGKKKQKTGLSFPVKLEHGGGEGAIVETTRSRGQDNGAGQSLRNRVNRLRERVLLSQSMIKPISLPGISDQMLPLTNSNGLTVAYGWDSLDILFVEYQVPLALIYGHPATADDMKKPLGFGLVSGAMDAPERHGGGGGGGGMGNNAGMSGSGSGRGMGGRPGGMTGQGQTMNGSAYDPNNAEQKTWLKLHLESK